MLGIGVIGVRQQRVPVLHRQLASNGGLPDAVAQCLAPSEPPTVRARTWTGRAPFEAALDGVVVPLDAGLLPAALAGLDLGAARAAADGGHRPVVEPVVRSNGHQTGWPLASRFWMFSS